jgi:hypothetical protein
MGYIEGIEDGQLNAKRRQSTRSGKGGVGDLLKDTSLSSKRKTSDSLDMQLGFAGNPGGGGGGFLDVLAIKSFPPRPRRRPTEYRHTLNTMIPFLFSSNSSPPTAVRAQSVHVRGNMASQLHVAQVLRWGSPKRPSRVSSSRPSITARTFTSKIRKLRAYLLSQHPASSVVTSTCDRGKKSRKTFLTIHVSLSRLSGRYG